MLPLDLTRVTLHLPKPLSPSLVTTSRGRVIAQTVSRRIHTAEGLCVGPMMGKMGLGQVFLQALRFNLSLHIQPCVVQQPQCGPVTCSSSTHTEPPPPFATLTIRTRIYAYTRLVLVRCFLVWLLG
jgi:hypothetical protein